MDAEKIDVGFIPDGNGRYAKREELRSVTEGHRSGAETMRELIERANQLARIRIFAIWGLSCKNLEKRSEDEVLGIYSIVGSFLEDLREQFLYREENKQVRLLHMGRRDRMQENEAGKSMLYTLDEIAAETRDRTGMVLALCLDYSGEDEFQRAIRSWAADGTKGDAGVAYRDYLDLSRQGLPFKPWNLIIRTGKEEDESDRDGAFLYPYVIKGETRLRPSTLLCPEFGPDQFEAEVRAYLAEKKREGGR